MENQSIAFSATLKEVAGKLEKKKESEKDFEEFLKAADATDRLPKGSS